MRSFATGLAAALLVLAGPQADPRAVANELLATDRAFSDSASLDAARGLGAMLAADVIMPGPGGTFADGRTQALALLNPAEGERLAWTPVHVGVSADGAHGFSFGFMTRTAPDGTRTAHKYLAWWVRGPDGWRVAAYKRRPRPDGAVPLELMEPALPDRIIELPVDPARDEALRRGLIAAEQAFSDEAQRIGLGPAFARHGSPDAMNMGGTVDPGFVIGADAIARAVTGGDMSPRSPVSWSADRALVAASGDLGITFGLIRPHQPAAGQPAAHAFFTIWRRPGGRGAWRYVAE